MSEYDGEDKLQDIKYKLQVLEEFIINADRARLGDNRIFLILNIVNILLLFIITFKVW